MKDKNIEGAKTHFKETNIQITCTGERHLEAVIGSETFRKEYVEDIVAKWVKEITLLSEIAVIEPQAAYTCYVSGYQHRFTYYLRTIPEISSLLRLVESVIRHQLLPAITGGHIVNDVERELMSLPPRLGGLGIKILENVSDIEYENSRKMTTELVNILLRQNENANEISKTKSQIKSERNKSHQNILQGLLSQMDESAKRQSEANQEIGASNWLTTLPIKESGYYLTKEQFFDALRIRYNWELPRLPFECACGSKFDLAHALSCKKGGFVTQRHNEVRDITAQLLKEVCKDVQIEPMLAPLQNERFDQKSAITSNEARL